MITINGRSRKREALARGQYLCPFEFKLVKGGVGGAVWFENGYKVSIMTTCAGQTGSRK